LALVPCVAGSARRVGGVATAYRIFFGARDVSNAAVWFALRLGGELACFLIDGTHHGCPTRNQRTRRRQRSGPMNSTTNDIRPAAHLWLRSCWQKNA
jgi:hypothetical protein